MKYGRRKQTHTISKKANLSDSLEDIGIGFHSSQDSYGQLWTILNVTLHTDTAVTPRASLFRVG